MKAVILISVVDDDESVRDATRMLLRSAGYEVSTFESGELFLESGTHLETRCLILDIRMPGMSSLELQRRLNLLESNLPVIFVTANHNEMSRQIAMDAGASDFFQKPFAVNDFLAAVHKALNPGPGSLATISSAAG